MNLVKKIDNIFHISMLNPIIKIKYYKNIPKVASMVILFLTLFILFPSILYADTEILTEQEIIELYNKSTENFNNAEKIAITNKKEAQGYYKEAAQQLEKIAMHVQNGKLYYNLGNIYFRLNDIGRAILNYKKAEQFIPNDIQLQQNLTYARSKCIDSIPEAVHSKVLRVLFFWHYDFTSYAKILLFVIFFSLLFIFLLCRLFIKKNFLIGCIIVSAFFSLSLFTSISISTIQKSYTKHGVIIAKEVVARKGNSTLYEPRFQQPLHAGTEFTLIEARDEWHQIELSDGNRAWIPNNTCEIY